MNKVSTKYTIDEKHTEMLNYFHDLETEIIPSLIKTKEELKSNLRRLPENDIDKYMELKDQIQKLTREINQKCSEKKKYLLDNSKHIFDYFEQKKQVSAGNNNQNTNVLNSFFKIKSPNTDSSNPQSSKYSQSKNTYHKYWKNINNSVLNIQDFVVPSDICATCKNGELIPQDEEGILICNNQSCGRFITYIIDNSKPSSKEPPSEVSYTAYIRLNANTGGSHRGHPRAYKKGTYYRYVAD